MGRPIPVFPPSPRLHSLQTSDILSRRQEERANDNGHFGTAIRRRIPGIRHSAIAVPSLLDRERAPTNSGVSFSTNDHWTDLDGSATAPSRPVGFGSLRSGQAQQASVSENDRPAFSSTDRLNWMNPRLGFRPLSPGTHQLMRRMSISARRSRGRFDAEDDRSVRDFQRYHSRANRLILNANRQSRALGVGPEPDAAHPSHNPFISGEEERRHRFLASQPPVRPLADDPNHDGLNDVGPDQSSAASATGVEPLALGRRGSIRYSRRGTTRRLFPPSESDIHPALLHPDAMDTDSTDSDDDFTPFDYFLQSRPAFVAPSPRSRTYAQVREIQQQLQTLSDTFFAASTSLHANALAFRSALPFLGQILRNPSPDTNAGQAGEQSATPIDTLTAEPNVNDGDSTDERLRGVREGLRDVTTSLGRVVECCSLQCEVLGIIMESVRQENQSRSNGSITASAASAGPVVVHEELNLAT
ncbi:hypothetical protein BC832DRAFT_552940 [Gaertneriomyces semiglobifer]|nr:hypothetical protein BC832DRAFT_552940 [Gaertneriomyces semiglobifer]